MKKGFLPCDQQSSLKVIPYQQSITHCSLHLNLPLSTPESCLPHLQPAKHYDLNKLCSIAEWNLGHNGFNLWFRWWVNRRCIQKCGLEPSGRMRRYPSSNIMTDYKETVRISRWNYYRDIPNGRLKVDLDSTVRLGSCRTVKVRVDEHGVARSHHFACMSLLFDWNNETSLL
jgi:hypothetical protein